MARPAASPASSITRLRAAPARALAPSCAFDASSMRPERNEPIESLPAVAFSATRTVLRYGSASRSACETATRRSWAWSSLARASSISGSAFEGALVAACARRPSISTSSDSASWDFSVTAASSGLSSPLASSARFSSSAIMPSKDAFAPCAPFTRAAASSSARRSPDASTERMAAMRSSIWRARPPWICEMRSRSMRSSISASRRMRVARTFASRRCASVAPAPATSLASVRSSLAASAGARSVCASSLASPPSTGSVLATASGEKVMRLARARALALDFAIFFAPCSAAVGVWRPLQAGSAVMARRAVAARMRARFMVLLVAGRWVPGVSAYRAGAGISDRGRPRAGLRGPAHPASAGCT